MSSVNGSKEAVSTEEYRQFIEGLELSAVWLAKCSVENVIGPGVYTGRVAVKDASSWRDHLNGFEATVEYSIEIKAHEGNEIGRLGVTFGLRFVSVVQMSDRLFAVFERVNLPVNSWPYLRQFVADTTGRMGWLPFTLPALKRGIQPRRK